MATTSAERMRWKRARDRGLVWGEGDESQLSDTALIGVRAVPSGLGSLQKTYFEFRILKGPLAAPMAPERPLTRKCFRVGAALRWHRLLE